MSKRSIIRRMLRIFRMWLMVRILERLTMDSSKGPRIISGYMCTQEFVKHRTLFRRRSYTKEEAYIALQMAGQFRYIHWARDDRMMKSLYATGKGLVFATPSGLINDLSCTIGNVPSVLTIFISVAAIIIAIFTKS